METINLNNPGLLKSLGVILFFLGVANLFYGFPGTWYNFFAMNNWQLANGTITDAKIYKHVGVEGDSPAVIEYYPDVKYEYSFDQRNYSGRCCAPGLSNNI